MTNADRLAQMAFIQAELKRIADEALKLQAKAQTLRKEAITLYKEIKKTEVRITHIH